jgi:pseudouridine-5'-phosphate glycosidase
MISRAPPLPVRRTSEVRSALANGNPVVALESSVLAQGLPIPRNREAATRMALGVAESGSLAAITAVVQGEATLGLHPDELERFLRRDGVVKASTRDLPLAMTSGGDAATTVAAALAICRVTQVPVFATGGVGGVHREPAYDESADLMEMARTPVVVVCAGAKSILDLRATVERLETLGVTVVGYRTDEFPGFFFGPTGLPVSHSAADPAEIARIYRAQRRLELPGALLVVQPPPPGSALSRDDVESATARALEEARRRGVSGPATTPFLLAALARDTGGRSLDANLALLEANARLAGAIAACIAEQARA